MKDKHKVRIVYCPRCHWLPRACWMAQELLYTFESEQLEVTLAPSPEGGVFQIHLGKDLIWDRKRDEGFPEIKVLKQLVRDKIAPARDLGHLDR